MSQTFRMNRAVSQAVLTMVLTATSAAAAQMFVPTGRGTLRGLPGVEVIVEDLPPEIAQPAFSTATIADDVRRLLRASGIEVYATQDENPSPAKPYLYVHVNAIALPGDAGHAMSVQLHLRQSVRSTVTESTIVNAVTWEVHNVLVVPPGRLAEVREEIQDYVRLFIDDWRSIRGTDRR